MAQTEIQGYTSAVKTKETLTPTLATSAISLDADTMGIIQASRTKGTGEIVPFIGKTRQEIDFLYPDWQQWGNGEPLTWYYDATAQTINLVPPPDATNVITNGISVWESRKPADLSSSTDIPFDSNNQMIPYHIAIVHWVVAQCWMDDGTPEALVKSKFHKSGSMLRPGQYEDQIGRILSEFDVVEAIPETILFQPQGGRLGNYWAPSKSNPLPWG